MTFKELANDVVKAWIGFKAMPCIDSILTLSEAIAAYQGARGLRPATADLMAIVNFINHIEVDAGLIFEAKPYPENPDDV